MLPANYACKLQFPPSRKNNFAFTTEKKKKITTSPELLAFSPTFQSISWILIRVSKKSGKPGQFRGLPHFSDTKCSGSKVFMCQIKLYTSPSTPWKKSHFSGQIFRIKNGKSTQIIAKAECQVFPKSEIHQLFALTPTIPWPALKLPPFPTSVSTQRGNPMAVRYFRWFQGIVAPSHTPCTVPRHITFGGRSLAAAGTRVELSAISSPSPKWSILCRVGR